MTAGSTPYSLLRRLTLAFALASGAAFAATGAYLYRALSIELERRDDIEIGGKLTQFLQLARASGSVQAVRANAALFRDVLLSHPGVYLGIYDARGRPLVEHADGSAALPRASAATPAVSLYPARTPHDCAPERIGPSRCIFADETLPSGEAVRVSLVRSAAERASLLGSYRGDIWLAVVVGASLVAGLGCAIVMRALAPMRSLGRQTSSIEAHNLNERLDIRGAPLELRELAVSVNRMLDRLERAFARLSQFSSDLAHDMRTPLANVISASQVTLSRPRTADEYEALIDSNIEECERLQRMIENMLFLARTDNATQHLKIVDLDAAGELRRLSSYFQGIADDCGVRIAVAVDGAARVRADPTLLRRAVSNLVSNALDHAFPASVVTLSALEAAGHTVVAVTNLGQPIANEHIGKIFERFYRVDASRHGSSKNAGLGLAIVKSIMELHRGKVDVSSGDGGTTFALHFPQSPGA